MTHGLTRRPPGTESGAGAPGASEFGRKLLEDNLGSTPHRLYVVVNGNVLSPLVSSGLELDPDDPWTIELTSPSIWSSARENGLSSLGRLSHRPGMGDPDARLRLWPVRRDGELTGGLLVRPTKEPPPATLSRRIRDPRFAAQLVLLLDYCRQSWELEELRVFRETAASVLPYGILGLDHLGRVTYVGGRASAILGLSEAEMIGSDCTRVLRPVGMQTNPLLEGLRTQQEPMELYIARPDDREAPISLQMMKLVPTTRQRNGLFAFLQDLSEERALEEAERQRDRLAALGELSAGVAHEIRNPLTGIANCAQVLSEGLEAGDRRQKFLGIILDETARLNRIVEGLLSYARPSRPDMRETVMEDVVRRAIDLVRSQADEKGIRMRLRLAGRIPKIYVDPAQVEQVLLNLLRNAQEAMPAGGEIDVRMSIVRRRPHRRRGTGRRAADRRQVRIGSGPLARFVQVRVADTGHGIPKDILPRVSNPFFSTRSKGTGLGLSLSHSIVREHGGFLTITSVEQKGTTVEIDLPVERRQGERRKGQRSV